jgi:hypothetical protein
MRFKGVTLDLENNSKIMKLNEKVIIEKCIKE